MAERSDAAGRSRAAARERPAGLPGGSLTQPLRRMASVQSDGRRWRDLAFCAVEAVLGLFGIVVLAVTLAFPVLLVSLAEGLAPHGRQHSHPSRTVIYIALALSLGAAVVLLPKAGRWLGTVHRRLAARLAGEPIEEPSGRPKVLRDGPGWRAVSYQVVKLPVTLAELCAVLLAVAGLASLTYPLWRGATFSGTLAVLAAGVGMLLTAPWAARAFALADRWLMRELLGPSRLARRVTDLEESRAMAVDDSAALLRRLERDLHDGAQIRLATLAMNLGMARQKLGDDADPMIRELMDAALLGAKDAIAELRSLVRGIHPPVLDNGLEDALATLASASAIPAEVTTDIGSRPAPAIETIAYFCAAELLTNAVKHSGASKVEISVTARKGKLELRVSDNGHGGAAPSGGSGLAGLAHRARTVDGRLEVRSPAGGPTRVTVLLPAQP